MPDNQAGVGINEGVSTMGAHDLNHKTIVSTGRKRRWLRRLFALPLLCALLSVLQVMVLRFVDAPLSTVMVLRYVEAWTEGDWGFRIQHEWRDLEQVSSNLPISLVAAEDQRFPLHRGFDLRAISAARAHNAEGRRLRGASTISQQVSKNLFLWQGRSWLRKGLEVWYTLLIESFWPKHRILEYYVNIAEFGDGVYGAQAAAQTFWGKDAAHLSAAESGRLAAVLPSPRRYSAQRPGPYVQRRAAWVQRQVRLLGGPAYLSER